MLKSTTSLFQRLVHPNILLTLIIIFYLINGIQYLRSQSITSDENSFYDYAKRYLRGNPERIDARTDNSKMPVSVLNTIPRVFEQMLHPGLEKRDGGVSDMINGRYITLFISFFTILLVYAWAKQLYGINAGIFATFLMSFCPNNISNAALVTTDSYSVLCLLAVMYYLWKFCRSLHIKYFILFSASVAVSQLAKQSLFHLYVIITVLLITYCFVKRPAIKFASVVKHLLIFVFINWFIINMGYYFYHTNQTLGSYHFMSNLFNKVQHIFPSWLPLPFPKPFVEGLDMAKYYDQIGGGYDDLSSFGKVTILEKSSTGGSFWYYYFVSLFYKTPISFLLFFIWSLIIVIRSTSLKKFIEREFFLLLPVLYLLITLSFFYKTQCGIRHIIFVFPFIFILSSAIIPLAKNRLSKIAITGLSIFLLVSVLRYWRNYYPYTNEFISDKKMAYSYVGASNLEFLQGNYFYRAYLQKHPEVQWVTSQPSTGIFLINVEDYLDIWNRHKYDWITNLKPCGVVAYSGLLIKVEPKDLPH